MKMWVGLWAVALLLIFASGRGPNGFETPEWRLGQWVRYDVTTHGETWQLEYALVGEEKNGGSHLFWLEARRLVGKDSLFVKWLVPKGLKGPGEKVLVGEGASACVEMSGSCLPEQFEEEGGLKGRTLDVLGEVETPAGSFLSEKFTCSFGLVWLSPKVPIFGIVKSTGKKGELVLVAYGVKGATSEMTEASGTVPVP